MASLVAAPAVALPDDQPALLVDLLFGGRFRDHLRRLQCDDENAKETDKHQSESDIEQLDQLAVSYVDSDWGIFSWSFKDVITLSASISKTLRHVFEEATPMQITDVATDQSGNKVFACSPVLVLFGDCGQWTPIFMLAALDHGTPFYSIDSPEQLKEALCKLPHLVGAIICPKNRLDELKSIGIASDWPQTYLQPEYCLLVRRRQKPLSAPATADRKLNIAYVINTSGTSSSALAAGCDPAQPTPTSKYVFVPHDAIVPNVIDFQREYSLTVNDVVFISSPFTFDPALCDTFLALSSFAHLVFASSTIRNSPVNVQRIFRQFGVSYTTCTPSNWRRLASSGTHDLLACLRVLNFGGEVSLTIEEIQSSIRPSCSNIRLYNLYGLTEVSAWASMFSLNDHLDHLPPPAFHQAFMPILGRPLLDTAVYLEGEQLVIESITRRCLILTTDNKWSFKSKYYTGDLGQQVATEAGLKLTYYLRRRDGPVDFVKINGVKCFLPFIEATVRSRFSTEEPFQVVQCTALAGDWHSWKQSVVDVVVQVAHLKIPLAKVSQTIVSRLASDIPFPIRCHLFDQSTMASVFSSNGKLDYGKLRRQLVTIEQFHPVDEAVTDEIESTVHSIIASATGLELAVVQANTDKELCHLGAASLAALQVTVQIEEKFKSSFVNDGEPQNLFETVQGSTIGAIVSYVRSLVQGCAAQSSTSSTTSGDSTGVPENSAVATFLCNDHTQPAFAIGRHFQLRQIVDLTGAKEIPNLVTISHQWSVFMEECIDATPLIVKFGEVTYLVAASHSGLVLALDPFTGTAENYRKLWSAQLSSRIEASPVASTDGRLIFTADYGGFLTALQTITGHIIWSYQTGDLIKCTPTTYEQLVLCGSHDGHLYVWHQLSGRLKWKCNLIKSAIFSSPVVHGGTRVIACTLNGAVICVSLSDGAIQWKQSLSHCPIFATPLLVGDTALIGLTEHFIVSISLSDGAIRWRLPTTGPTFSSPVAFQTVDGITAAIVGTHGKLIYCINTDTGTELWHQETGSLIYSSAFIVGGVAILVETDAIVHLLDCQTGKATSIRTKDANKWTRSEQYRTPIEGKIFASPLYYQGKLFIGSRDSCLHCFHIQLD